MSSPFDLLKHVEMRNWRGNSPDLPPRALILRFIPLGSSVLVYAGEHGTVSDYAIILRLASWDKPNEIRILTPCDVVTVRVRNLKYVPYEMCVDLSDHGRVLNTLTPEDIAYSSP